mmetsp:Transcript_3288/g.6585  ORF Transcript_3288/g.6585 Transcript_3288/m.6585 type:complete len:246 (-) Transcript_3288:360-1097(-)
MSKVLQRAWQMTRICRRSNLRASFTEHKVRVTRGFVASAKNADIVDEDDEQSPFDEELVGSTGQFEQIILENTDWGQKALDCAQQILENKNELALYGFRAYNASKRIDIRIDKLTDTYGSPTLDEIGEFSRDFNQLLESNLGEETAASIEIEVSSPGAERSVRIPDELLRFKALPMSVCSTDAPEPRVFNLQAVLEDGTTTVWAYADVRANRSLGKGRGLSKKQKEMEFTIPIENIISVNIHLDV